MKLGKKLDVTDIYKRLKLLIDGQQFNTVRGENIRFSESSYAFMLNTTQFSHLETSILCDDWYYPPKEYTINGVTLTDERVFPPALIEGQTYYVSATSHHNHAFGVEFLHEENLETMRCHAAESLLHYTEEAAIAHTNAMIMVSE